MICALLYGDSQTSSMDDKKGCEVQMDIWRKKGFLKGQRCHRNIPHIEKSGLIHIFLSIYVFF